MTLLRRLTTLVWPPVNDQLLSEHLAACFLQVGRRLSSPGGFFYMNQRKKPAARAAGFSAKPNIVLILTHAAEPCLSLASFAPLILKNGVNLEPRALVLRHERLQLLFGTGRGRVAAERRDDLLGDVVPDMRRRIMLSYPLFF